ncbi:hypothetical protein PIB30_055828 [Stylosanthes scabra]|uniref:Uncharacterized protein n=1 Tax=Stylosanthes scabra TaxID=79078 RepID=A0ABU6XH52_9FABA|nr:hypothetical protein [Stylosanthes scabra]
MGRVEFFFCSPIRFLARIRASLIAVASAMILEFVVRVDVEPPLTLGKLSLITTAAKPFLVSELKAASTLIFSQSLGGGLQITGIPEPLLVLLVC